MSTSHHVVPHPNGWCVKKGGSDRASACFSTQKEAIDAGREISRNQGSEFYIHGRNGAIRQKDSHGNDSYPPEG